MNLSFECASCAAWCALVEEGEGWGFGRLMGRVMLGAGKGWRLGRGPEGDDGGMGVDVCDGHGWKGWV